MLPRVHTTTRAYEMHNGEGGASMDSVSETYDEDLDGDIAIPMYDAKAPLQMEMNTLDEPIKDTILRDLKAVGVKFRYVLQPYRLESKLLLKEWDLWGPLLLCTFMAILLQGKGSEDSSNNNDGGPAFAEVFVIVWVGSLVVTVNSRLLGGNMSIFQSVCVIGYCLIAPSVALVLCQAILLHGRSSVHFTLRLVIALIAFLWSTASCMVFLGESQVRGRKALAGYPICLFYAVICWLVASHND